MVFMFSSRPSPFAQRRAVSCSTAKACSSRPELVDQFGVRNQLSFDVSALVISEEAFRDSVHPEHIRVPVKTGSMTSTVVVLIPAPLVLSSRK
jgi:hypothetical protein